MYDNPAPPADFHREGWILYCSSVVRACIAAPRGHAKSTAFTHTFTLATVLFRAQDFIVLVSATEDLAINHLGDIATELRENEDIRRDFQVAGFDQDSKTDIIVRFKDGHKARIIAKGSGQKMRGLKWNGKRPGLIIGDDLEEDEQVETQAQRMKFQRWFDRALIPCLRKGGQARIHGTILHEDSLLAKLMAKKSTWRHLLYRAHKSFDDFSEILWPEQYDEAFLRDRQAEFVSKGDATGYSQEYLNDPLDMGERYLKKEDFFPMTEEDHEEPKVFCVGCDFAVSKKDKANRTSFTVGGKDLNNLLHFVDQVVGRMDALEWIDKMFELQRKWDPAMWFVEGGQIWAALKSTIYNEMRERDIWLNIKVYTPISDKATRGRPYQKRMRAKACRFDTSAPWYPSFEDENLRFTGFGEARLDDQFDSAAILTKGMEDIPVAEPGDFEEEDEEMYTEDPRQYEGRSAVTGY